MESDGLEGFEELLENILESVEEKNIVKALEKTAKKLVRDVKTLPKPRSQTRKAGYTHLLNTATSRTVKNEVEVGWGKYYGPMLERGTRKMPKGAPHYTKVYERNKKIYYTDMQKELFG